MQLIRNFICSSGVIKVSVLLRMKTGEAGDNAVKSPQYHPEAEWPLLILTVSLQSAVGTFIWGLLWAWFGPLSAEILLSTLALGVIGMLGATRHLASPLRAPRAILNWRSSWLSREIILSSAFLGFVLLDAGLSLLPFIMGRETSISSFVSSGINILTGITGIALVAAMSMIYLVPSRPVWNHQDTPISFYAGALQIGWAISAAIMVFRIPWPGWGTIVLAAVGLILLTLLRLKVLTSVIDRLSGLHLYQDQLYGWQNYGIRRTRIGLALAGGIAAPLVGTAVMFLPGMIRGGNPQWIWILGALLLIIGEGIDRWVFFQASPAVIFPPRF